MTKRVLLTGGAGFIGHYVLDAILNTTDWHVTLMDRLDESGNFNRIAELQSWKEFNHRTRVFFHDIRAPLQDLAMSQLGQHDIVLHLAAATHVDRSITDPMHFVMSNVVGTCNMLDYARKTGCELFLNFGTDEVFGPAPNGVRYHENDRYNSGNPYAATKAGAEELAVSYHNTYGLPVICTHTMNVFGQRQHPEKFIPMTISKIRAGALVSIHSNKSKTKAGSRFYIHGDQVADAVMHLIKHGVVGEKYNIVGEKEVDNLELALAIANAMGKPLNYEMVDFHSSRPGHDLRYALDGNKMHALGWTPFGGFRRKLDETVHWSLNNDHWLIDYTAHDLFSTKGQTNG